jgi:hypothetical protein
VTVSESFNLAYLIGERVFHTDRQLGAGSTPHQALTLSAVGINSTQ